ncbi:phosphosulfolactate synthase [Crocinitomicaceae bacterium CZZ-1]|uniref:Phosphosulfolactate synthase n=1 Tax=Taishania pollutisoli TaxID=2766479 RepID=A0A8J6PLH2_9FLAO|nr:phosphosulfolactate synthase [Taishania pollutisoli]MBC9812990.1 phosphosulfolactate synthase [Taishania pollutisoli]MBX2948724.1 phosphosulfolactate synthase [Crocinitomicaceae bacterium]NGF75693.1 phosphosulfolactate synthase [Fluviicola sp. SGL-29]
MNFELPFIPERSEKPRNKGVTMMMDKGLSLIETEAFIQANAHLTDLVKFGFGTAYVTKDLEKKLALYREANIRPYFGGTLFEVFYARGKFDDFLKLLDKYNMDLLEISDGSIIINHDEKCELIHRLSKERTVLSEVGSKDSGILISPARWIKMMSKELSAGSWKVIAEGREAGNVGVFRPNGTAHTFLINKIISKVKPEDILWEAPIKNQQVWFIKLFGAEVNLGNIAPNDIIPLECLRLGLRGDTFFDFLPKDYAERLKQVNDDEELAQMEEED